MEPKTDIAEDVEAAKTAFDFFVRFQGEAENTANGRLNKALKITERHLADVFLLDGL